MFFLQLTQTNNKKYALKTKHTHFNKHMQVLPLFIECYSKMFRESNLHDNLLKDNKKKSNQVILQNSFQNWAVRPQDHTFV